MLSPAAQGLGVKEYHRSCTDNLREGLQELGLTPPETPSPFNLWMNIPWTEEPRPAGTLEFVAPVSKPGDYIVMRADMDCIIAFSACPQVRTAKVQSCLLPLSGKISMAMRCD